MKEIARIGFGVIKVDPEDLIVTSACPHCGKEADEIFVRIKKEPMGLFWQFKDGKFVDELQGYKYITEKAFCGLCKEEIPLSELKYRWK